MGIGDWASSASSSRACIVSGSSPRNSHPRSDARPSPPLPSGCPPYPDRKSVV